MTDYKTEVRQRDDYTCQKCGYRTEDTTRIDVHHIKPKKVGGEDTPENCAILCKNCHDYVPDLTSAENYEMLFEDFCESGNRPEIDIAEFTFNSLTVAERLREQATGEPDEEIIREMQNNESRKIETIIEEEWQKTNKKIIWLMFGATAYTHTKMEFQNIVGDEV